MNVLHLNPLLRHVALQVWHSCKAEICGTSKFECVTHFLLTYYMYFMKKFVNLTKNFHKPKNWSQFNFICVM